jgi:hypothetical protein
MSNNLGLAQIAPAQSAKYATSNTADGQIDAALTEVLSLEVDNTNAATLTDEQLRRHFFVDIDPDTTPPDAAVTITVPAIKRGLFAVRNNTAQTATVTVSGQSLTAPEIAAGQAALLSCDGSDVRAEGSGSGGGASVSLPYDFGFVKAVTPTSSEIIGKVVIPRDITLPADFSGAYGHVDTNPTATFDIDVTDDGSSIGTISIATDGTFTFITAGNTAKSVTAGSVIRFVAPASTDATVAGIAATLVGTLT